MIAKRIDSAIYFDEPSLTNQSFKDECDANLIVKRFKQVNGIDFLRANLAHADGMRFGDFSNVGDFREALDVMRKGEQAFDSLPEEVRSKFRDFRHFAEFSDRASVDDYVNLGLVSRKDLKEVGEADVKADAKSA